MGLWVGCGGESKEGEREREGGKWRQKESHINIDQRNQGLKGLPASSSKIGRRSVC